MLEKLHAYYAQNHQYAPRLSSDVYFSTAEVKGDYSGIADEMARFIERIQLKDRSLWTIFAHQFAVAPDEVDNGWRGEYWGKMMRGACMTYQYTRDPDLYDLLTEAVLSLMENQDEEGRITTYPKHHEFDGWDLWGRKYVLLGLLHFHEICEDEQLRDRILTVCLDHAEYIIRHIGPGVGQKNITEASRHWGGINSSSILEPMMRLYNATGRSSLFDFATYIIENGGSKNGNIFEAAVEGKLYPYQYVEVKAYELMSCFEGLIEYYRVTGEEKWLTALRNFTRMLMESDVTIIGCSGCTHELLDHSAERQTFTQYPGVVQETCVTVTFMKLCYQMFCLTGDPVYADAIERSAFNALYGAVNTEGRTENMGLPFDSYSPLLLNNRGRKVGGIKRMENDTVYYGCCACIGAAGTAMLPTINVMLSRAGFLANYYLPGKTEIPTPAGQTCVLSTETKYPVEGKITMHLSLLAPEAFTLSLRIPAFAEKPAVLVNGAAVSDVTAGEYLHLSRTWQSEDTVELTFGMPARIHRGAHIEEDPMSERHTAITVGPLVLARDARIGEVGTPVVLARDENGNAILTPAELPDFPAQCAYDALCADGSRIRLIDYASAGKTWNNESRMECWMPEC